MQTINYNNVLTAEFKKHIAESIYASKCDGNIEVSIDSDRFISLFADKLPTEQYSSFDWETAEELVFNYLESKI